MKKFDRYIVVNRCTGEVLGHEPHLWNSVDEIVDTLPCMETAETLEDDAIGFYKVEFVCTLLDVKAQAAQKA